MNNIFNLQTSDKVAVFIDGANTFQTVKALDYEIDFKKILSEIKENAYLVRAFYYTAMLDTSKDQSNPLKKLTDWLNYNGFHVVTKLAKSYTNEETNETRTKGNMDIELAIDMLTMVKHYDVAILFSGDGDFRRLVEEVQKRGKRVVVVSSFQTRPRSYIADELRKQADVYVDLADVIDELRKPERMRIFINKDEVV